MRTWNTDGPPLLHAMLRAMAAGLLMQINGPRPRPVRDRLHQEVLTDTL
jgi:hypothetical protein